jgi:plasmid maintenance system killer protein
VKISFASAKLERELSDEKEMKRAYGDLAKRLRLRLAVLRSVKSLAEVPSTPPDRRHELGENLAGHFAVHINGNWRLIFRPSDDPVPRTEDGGFDLGRIVAVEITTICAYH